MAVLQELEVYNNYSKVAYATIVQAVQDYFEYSRAVMRGQSKFGQSKAIMEKYLQEVVDFFTNKNGYYKFYSEVIDADSGFNLTGERIMKTLDPMIADEEKYPDDFISLSFSY